MDDIKNGQHCPRCERMDALEEICSVCVSELLELHDHRISWRMALEIEREEKEGENISIQIQ